MKRASVLISLCLIVATNRFANAQESVIGLFKGNLQQGNYYYKKQNYEKAIKYFSLVNKSKIDQETQLKIARSFYFIKNYSKAAKIYLKARSEKPLGMPDLLYLAELNSSVGNYPAAAECYNNILQLKPDDPAILQKIWQLNNLNLLYEDSIHFTVRELPLNTKYAELSAYPFQNGIIFLSDRKEVDFRNPDGESSPEVFKFFIAEIIKDTTLPGFNTKFRKATNFGKAFHSTSGFGPASFFASDNKCVFAAYSNERASDGVLKMQLFFSELINGKWSMPKGFEHNNKEFNLTEPSISADGSILFFSSDKPGGFGGSDIYKCELKGGTWTTPENLGDRINTSSKESFPFLYYNNTLYFSSDGHPGLGGLDIFSTIVTGKKGHDIINMGYPINSGSDDFGFSLETGSHGYFSSNRKHGGFNDDLYEFDMDFRTYPFEISGVIKLSGSKNADTTSYNPMANAQIELLDYGRDQVITRTQTDTNGQFSVSIPWFSKYVLRLTDRDDQEYIVSLEIDKESSENSNYEIVVVKKSFNDLPKTKLESE
jgi:hypothetical protein